MHKIFFLLSLLALAPQAFAETSISVSGQTPDKTRILFVGFDSTNPGLKRDSFEVFERVRRNLKTTNLFEVVKDSGQAASELSANLAVEATPDFAKYSKAQIGAIAIAQFDYDLTGNLEVKIRVWDVLDQRQFFGKLYTASHDNYRKISNAISNEIYKAVTGERVGHFDSQIIYVSEFGPINKRVKRLNVIGFDGENRRVLTTGQNLVLTPIFSKKRDEAFYVNYLQGRPQIFSLNLINLRSQKVGGFRGTTFSASPHPKDSNLLLLSVIDDGNSDIYELNISENTAHRLTKHPAIDTTPTYSPDAKSIVFSSDREGGQQLYVMDADGSSVKKISKGEGNYSKPVWSPDGRLIAFTKIQKGQFYIGVMSPSGHSEKTLASGYLVEGERWSPSGRYLIFSRKKSPYGVDSMPRLYIVDVLTGFEFELPTPANEGATDPDWGS
ncbi:MAG: Tol-Pal system protein TolB [Alphaproteobacteria bacterium]|nr:Tol-Pal system protein TolB [Alphaproteobacteria bacterium]